MRLPDRQRPQSTALNLNAATAVAAADKISPGGLCNDGQCKAAGVNVLRAWR
jgi:hypothetical protein